MKNMNKQKGITLVSLVITIIVLIILAGVSLNVIIGENGILTKSKNTLGEYEKARQEEEKKLKEMEGLIETITEPWDGQVSTDFANNNTGDNKDEPYIITNGAELAYFAQEVNDGNTFEGKYIEITKSINLNNQKISPIGLGDTTKNLIEGEWANFKSVFKGTLNGNGNIITGININEPEVCGVGLIGVLDTVGIIENLTIYDGQIIGKTCVGGIVGVNGGTIRNCTNKVTIIAQDNVDEANSGNVAGGIVGWHEKGFVENCTNYGSIITKNDSLLDSRGKMAGGIVGAARSRYSEGTSKAEIKKCTNNGKVNAVSQQAGGIVGYVAYASKENTIEDCINKGNVVGKIHIGGIVGELAQGNGIISNCENTGEIMIEGKGAGGIIGLQQSGTIINCSNSGKIDTKSDSDGYIGGIVGDLTNGKIEMCTNSGIVMAQTAYYAGGIVGYQRDNNATDTVIVSNCNNTGNINATQNAGGIAGRFKGNVKISSCMNSGTIKVDKDQVGGISGSQEGGIIEKVSNTGTIKAGVNAKAIKRRTAGGIIGTQWSGDVTEAYNSGTVTVESDTADKVDVIGGIIGYQYVEGNGSRLSKAYNKGSLGTSDAVGAIIGHKVPTGIVEKSYYYTQGTEKGIGSETDSSTVVAAINDTTGKTEKVTDNLTDYNSFIKWIGNK